MAQIEMDIDFKPIMPRIDEIDSEDLLVRYDDEADILNVHFFGRPRPAVIVDITECLNLRVDVQTQQVVGLQIDDYLSYAVQHDPALLEFAELAGIEPAVIDKVRRAIAIDRKRRSALRAILTDVDLAIA